MQVQNGRPRSKFLRHLRVTRAYGRKRQRERLSKRSHTNGNRNVDEYQQTRVNQRT